MYSSVLQCFVPCLSRFYHNLHLAVAKVSDLLQACLLTLSLVYLLGRYPLAINMQTFPPLKKKKNLSLCLDAKQTPLIETDVPDKTKQRVERRKVNIWGCFYTR